MASTWHSVLAKSRAGSEILEWGREVPAGFSLSGDVLVFGVTLEHA